MYTLYAHLEHHPSVYKESDKDFSFQSQLVISVHCKEFPEFHYENITSRIKFNIKTFKEHGKRSTNLSILA